MRIDLTPEARQAEGIALQTARQHSDRDHQQEPIDSIRLPQTAARQLEDTGCAPPSGVTQEVLRPSPEGEQEQSGMDCLEAD